jgi:NADPH:quinone reductase-like Zn-dependent oxidoreductase
MKAVIYTKYGPPETLKLVDKSMPVPADNEVLIRIKASTVTSADCLMRRGNTVLSRLVLGLFTPRKRYQILGTEFSGVIESAGNGVQKFKSGDEVFGFRGFGTGCYAEYKCISENASLALKPVNLTFEEAASIVDGASTAIFFLRDLAGIKKGQKVLINGAAGSIGTFAVQLAKIWGADVTGVCSTKNIDLVKSLGADSVIDYTKQDFTTLNNSYDIIFDTVSKSSFSACRKALKPDGKYLVTVFSLRIIFQMIWTTFFSHKKVLFSMSVDKRDYLWLIKNYAENKELKTIVDKYYDLKDISDAHAYVEKGHKCGNVVIKI